VKPDPADYPYVPRATPPHSQRRPYDVAVVGAGPAGATAARFLALAGLRVALIDRKQAPRHKACGGGISARIREYGYLFDQIPRCFDEPCHGFVTHSPYSGVRYACVERDPVFYSVDRASFDAGLCWLATQAGAEYIAPYPAGRFEREPGPHGDVVIHPEVFKGQTAPPPIRASILILAAGSTTPILDAFAEAFDARPKDMKHTWGIALERNIPYGEELMRARYGEGHLFITHFLRTPNFFTYGWAFPRKHVMNVGTGAF
jgi:flavin-dependent dehydrogenase